MRSLRTGVLLLLPAVPALLGSAATAHAHPFGTPPAVRVSGR
ncbi:hypothetical protein AB0N06_23370 [Streptomyces sp. NPDC051020]